MSAQDDEFVGYTGTGNFGQSGGTNAIAGDLYLGYYPSGNGSYTLSGTGQLSAGDEYVAYSGAGSFTQSGGTNAASGDLYLGGNIGSGAYNLSGSGQLTTPYEYVGWSSPGNFTQSGGTNTVSGRFYLGYGSSGTYNLNGGRMIVSWMNAGSGAAAFNFSGGTLQAGASFSTGLPITLNTSGGIATIDTAGYLVTLGGVLSGPGSLDKIGSGTLVLSGTNTYTGGTMLSDGTLSITNSSAVGSGGLCIGPQGLFNLNAQNYVLPSLSGSAGGVLTDLSTATTGTSTLTVNTLLSASSNYGGTICDGSSRTLSLIVSGFGDTHLVRHRHLYRRHDDHGRHARFHNPRVHAQHGSPGHRARRRGGAGGLAGGWGAVRCGEWTRRGGSCR